MRDRYLNESVLWTQTPNHPPIPAAFRVGAALCLLGAVVSACFAVVVWDALGRSPLELALQAGVCVGLAVALLHWPRLLRQRVRYALTDRHVVVERGNRRRVLARNRIGFARVWRDRRRPGFGTVELVAPTPDGVFRRQAALRLDGIRGPDELLALMRGVAVTAANDTALTPLGQRLDPGERVLWSAAPRHSLRHCIPRGTRRLQTAGIAVMAFAVAQVLVGQLGPNARRLIAAGLDDSPLALGALLAAQALVVTLTLGVALYCLHFATLRHLAQLRRTRYAITNRRVLIQRGSEELHVDRAHVVDIIDVPASVTRDLFLVLDGPNARAFATHGAWEDTPSDELSPILESVLDPEGASNVLLRPDIVRAAA